MDSVTKGPPQSCTQFLPIEIWEIIIKLLLKHPTAIISAANVCTEWRQLATIICKRFCKTHLNDKLLEELLDIKVSYNKKFFKENGDIDWIRIYWLYHETVIDVDTKKNIIPLQLESTSTVASEDPYMVISTYNRTEDKTKIMVLNSEDFSFLETFIPEESVESLLHGLSNTTSFHVSGKVYQTCFLYLSRPILMLVSTMDLRAVTLEGTGADKDKLELFTNPRIKGDSKISCDGKYLLVAETDSLLLYKAMSVNEANLELYPLHRLRPSAMPYHFAVSKAMIYTMEPTGHIKTYKVDDLSEEGNLVEQIGTVSLYAQSDLKKDLRYPNPTIFFRDMVFSSTLVSRNLLWYWHMDRGRDYWLVGDLAQNSACSTEDVSSRVPCIRLCPVHIGHDTGLTVTTIHLQRGILLCGTSEGNVLGYRLVKNVEETPEKNYEDLTKTPWLLVEGVSSLPIFRLGCLFTPLGLMVATVNEVGCCSVVYIPSKNTL